MVHISSTFRSRDRCLGSARGCSRNDECTKASYEQKWIVVTAYNHISSNHNKTTTTPPTRPREPPPAPYPFYPSHDEPLTRRAPWTPAPPSRAPDTSGRGSHSYSTRPPCSSCGGYRSRPEVEGWRWKCPQCVSVSVGVRSRREGEEEEEEEGLFSVYIANVSRSLRCGDSALQTFENAESHYCNCILEYRLYSYR